VHPEFAEWYRLVNPAPTAEVLQSRWTAIETLSKAPKSALGAIRVALGLPPGQNDYLKNFPSCLRPVSCFRVVSVDSSRRMQAMD